MIKFRECPFCGGEAFFDYDFREYFNSEKEYYVQCRKCSARTKPILFERDGFTYPANTKLLKLWNTRHTSIPTVLQYLQAKRTKFFQKIDDGFWGERGLWVILIILLYVFLGE